MTPDVRAKEGGYKLTRTKAGSYIGNFKGVEFEDDDPDRLCDDMDAVKEIAESDEFTLLDEADEDGESIVEVKIGDDTRQFINISVAAALAEAKEALLASKPKPAARGRARRTAAAAESLAEAEEASRVTPDKEEIIPPVGGGDSNVLKIDLRAFQAAVRELADASANLRKLVEAAVEGAQPTYAEGEAEEAKPRRGRGGRPRRGNGR